jgi:regulatory protein
MQYTLKEAIKKLENYCIYQNRCHSEVEQKLWDTETPPHLHDEVLLHLIQKDYLNEERFAQSFARGKFSLKKWGRNKIKQHLKQKKVSEHCIKKGLQEIDEDKYLETLKYLLEKKKSLVKGKNQYDKNAKVANYLIGKGYESGLVWEMLKA